MSRPGGSCFPGPPQKDREPWDARSLCTLLRASEHSSGPVNFEGHAEECPRKGWCHLGESMDGKRLTNCLLEEAVDGCRAVIALPEFGPGVHR